MASASDLETSPDKSNCLKDGDQGWQDNFDSRDTAKFCRLDDFEVQSDKSSDDQVLSINFSYLKFLK